MEKKTPKILLVDDDADLLDMYEESIQIEGVQVLKAESVKVAIEHCKNHANIQVILSDNHMKGMTGMEFLINLKNQYETIPVFYLLTGSFDISEEDIISKGGGGLILKPFDLDEILERIKKDIKF